MASKSVQSVEVKDGRDLKILRKDGSTLYRVGFDGGGVVPSELDSLFTSTRAAELAIQKYLTNRK